MTQNADNQTDDDAPTTERFPGVHRVANLTRDEFLADPPDGEAEGGYRRFKRLGPDDTIPNGVDDLLVDPLPDGPDGFFVDTPPELA